MESGIARSERISGLSLVFTAVFPPCAEDRPQSDQGSDPRVHRRRTIPSSRSSNAHTIEVEMRPDAARGLGKCIWYGNTVHSFTNPTRCQCSRRPNALRYSALADTFMDSDAESLR